MSNYESIQKILPKLKLEPMVAQWAQEKGLCYHVSESNVTLKGPTGEKILNVSPLGMSLLETGQLGSFSLEALQKSFTTAINSMMSSQLDEAIAAKPAEDPLAGAAFSFTGSPKLGSTIKKKTTLAAKKKAASEKKAAMDAKLAELKAEAAASAPPSNMEGIFESGNENEMAEAIAKLHDIAEKKTKLKPTPEAEEADWKASVPHDLEPPVGGVDAIDLGIMSKGKVKLLQATKMYQPVSGTSGGSIYFCIAADQDLRFAVRITGHTLSMRVEGNLSKRTGDLEAAGIPVKGDYASEHVKFSDETELKRILGAAIMSLNLDSVWPLPKVAHILNQGA